MKPSPSRAHEYAMSTATSTIPTLYIRPDCPRSHEAVSFLMSNGVTYREKDVSEDDTALAEMKKKSGRDRTPVLDWDDEILAAFGVERLKEFLLQKEAHLEDS